MKIIVFTDLDATLLDSRTYCWRAAAEALEELKLRKAEVVLVSSKTFAEMVPLYRELGFSGPFVVENGGGIAFPADSPMTAQLEPREGPLNVISPGEFAMISLGTRYDELVQALADIGSEVGVELRGFASMTDAEVASLTDLEPGAATCARKRNYDEPFIIPVADASKQQQIVDAAAARGLTVVQGGRFWHLIGHCGKGTAVSILLEIYRKKYPHLLSVGLGDSPNDFPFLELVEIPILVGACTGAMGMLSQNSENLVMDRTAFVGAVREPSEVRELFEAPLRAQPSTIQALKQRPRRSSFTGGPPPHVQLIATPGPEGWNRAILAILSELKEVTE